MIQDEKITKLQRLKSAEILEDWLLAPFDAFIPASTLLRKDHDTKWDGYIKIMDPKDL